MARTHRIGFVGLESMGLPMTCNLVLVEKTTGMRLPMAAAARQIFLAESGAGGGRSADSQVIRASRRLCGLGVTGISGLVT